MKKIAFICADGLGAFVRPVVNSLPDTYETQLFLVRNEKEINEAIEWGDILWFEWANEVAVYGTRVQEIVPDDQKIIVRLHSYEALSGLAKRISWHKVDACIFVAAHVHAMVQHQITAIDEITKCRIVHNGVDTKAFNFEGEKQPGKDIAFLGNISNKKGPMLLMQAFNVLPPEYKLHIAGAMQEERYNIYLGNIIKEMGIEDRVEFCGAVDNVPEWLQDKQYIVCTSPWEGCPVGLLEAMACGLKPLIHSYVGSRDLFPDEWIWATVDDFKKMALDTAFEPKKYRRFVEKDFSFENQMKGIRDVLDEVVG